MGRFNMDGTNGRDVVPQAVEAEEKRARPAKTGGEKQMAMLRRMPKILRFIPGSAQDVRAYFLTLQYWLAGSDENMAQHGALPVQPLCERPARKVFAASSRRRCRSSIPDVGVYHPRAQNRVGERLDALPHAQGARRYGRRAVACALMCSPATRPTMTP